MNRKKSKRRTSGQALVELAAGLIVFIPVILLLIDCAVIMIGVSVNEAACRDAARAASSGPPASTFSTAEHVVGSSSSPYKRASSVVKDVYTVGGFVSISQTLTVKEALNDPVPQAPTGGPFIGTVTVETTANISPPFLIRSVFENGNMQLKNSQRYPYTYVMPGA